MKKAYVFLADGFETVEALAVVDILRRGKVDVKTVSVMEPKEDKPMIKTAQGVIVEADQWFKDLNEDADLLFLPGGLQGTNNLAAHKELAAMLKDYAAAGRYVSAICAGPSVLGGLGLLEGKRCTCYPGFEDRMTGGIATGARVEQDGNIITSRGMGCAVDMGLYLLALLQGKEVSEEIKEAIQY